ncbi:hypothetical protein BIFGAL_03838 [Bifidobacterium gallicum DSM 20093 = LMG 11596]|uniref:Uncharacterized protein n=1 Tax=Bifidobacterium gallicum DSM 20093 = LMG 11596 TaxID=561180 RepID=D1NVF3_9BIFI|nr:hypothetical protein BIFGAL_03838 [Bifidobacterium gallicum DSM 20093 = LMG 11596]
MKTNGNHRGIGGRWWRSLWGRDERDEPGDWGGRGGRGGWGEFDERACGERRAGPSEEGRIGALGAELVRLD